MNHIGDAAGYMSGRTWSFWAVAIGFNTGTSNVEETVVQAVNASNIEMDELLREWLRNHGGFSVPPPPPSDSPQKRAVSNPKIAKLQAVANDPAATPSEKATAMRLIERIKHSQQKGNPQ